VSLRDARQILLDALTAGGVRAFYGFGGFTTPCARIYPGDPWIGQMGLADGRRIQRWEVWAVAGKADAVANFEEMEALVIQCNLAVEGMRSWNRIDWRRPGPVDMGGTKYLACRGVIETILEA
jgi:hypothetical protein